MTDRASEQLLVVDDDATFARVLGRALERRGYRVQVAAGFDEALALSRASPPDYAVVDLSLPDASGLALIPLLRQVSPSVRILVLTGYASVATAIEAIKLGAVHYLAKPADADEVVAALHRNDGDAQLRVELRPPSVARLTWEHIQRVLREQGGNVSATARALGMHRRTLQRKLAKRPARF